MKFPLGEMTVGDILDRGIKLLFARLPTFYLINLLVLGPVIVAVIALPLVIQAQVNNAAPGRDLTPIFAAMGLMGIGVLLTLILQPIGSAAILHIIMEEYVGRKVSIGQAFSYALTRFLPLIGASIIVGLLVMVGMFLCCVPGLYFWVTYAFVSQIVVLEKLGPSDALNRSSKLVNGHRWRVFGVLVLIYIANAIVSNTVQLAMATALPTEEQIPAANGPRVQFNAVNHIIDTLVTQLVGIVFSTYIAVCTTLLYLDLRIRKEGFDLEMAAEDEAEFLDSDEADRDRDDEDDDRNRRDRYDDDRYDDDRYDDRRR
jgi:hypothetical protein